MTSGNINIDVGHLQQALNTTDERLQKVMSQLSSGKGVLRPGDEVVNYERASALGFEKAESLAKMQAMQSRVTWYQASVRSLQEINDILASMGDVALQAKSPQRTLADLQASDVTFQQLKERIAQIVDGFSGTQTPAASFLGRPLFLSYHIPMEEIGQQVLTDKADFEGINLYTALQTPGFRTLSLIPQGATETSIVLTGTAQNTVASALQVTLDEDAAGIDNVYEGLEITLTDAGGTVSETATIASYDAQTRIATLSSALSFAVDNTYTYSLDSGVVNRTVDAGDEALSVAFAESVWGADNYRLDRLSTDRNTFVALTEAERTFRTANGIPNTDLNPKTYEEEIARRKLNIFDSEYGNIMNPENASRMFAQIERAVDQISVMITRQEAQAANAQAQFRFFEESANIQGLGMDASMGVDLAAAGASLQDLLTAQQRIMEVASRLAENFAKLTELARNR